MKYMGSKARVSKELSIIINNLIKGNNIKKYVEPFVGGANMIDKIICDNKYGIDKNNYLIDMWNAILKGWIPPLNVSKELYDDVKKNKDKYKNELVAVIGFCSTYNAKWFGGYAGIVKTKDEKFRNYYDESIRNILKQSERLKDVKFIQGDYRKCENINNSLIYCDPPYANTTQYDKNVVDVFDHNIFWEWCRDMSKNNIVLISEYNAPEDFECIWQKELTTTLDKNSRKKDIEKLFKYKY